MENEIEKLEEQIKEMQERYDSGNVYGKRSDLLCDITMTKVKLEKLKEAKTLAWRNRTIKYLAKVNFQ